MLQPLPAGASSEAPNGERQTPSPSRAHQTATASSSSSSSSDTSHVSIGTTVIGWQPRQAALLTANDSFWLALLGLAVCAVGAAGLYVVCQEPGRFSPPRRAFFGNSQLK
jgi:hypothetical protein